MILLQRYFFNQLLWPFITAIAAFAGLALLTQSLSNVDLVSGYSETALTFVKVTALALPQLTALLVPIALFVAVLSTLNRLTSDSELVIASAAGLSRFGLLSPVIRLGIYVLLANLVVNLLVQPIAYREMRRELHTLRSDVAASLATPGAFSQPGPGGPISARDRRRAGRTRAPAWRARGRRPRAACWCAPAAQGRWAARRRWAASPRTSTSGWPRCACNTSSRR